MNATRPMSYLFKTAHSTVKSPIHKNKTFKNSNIDQKVNTISGKKFNTARPKAVVNAVKGNSFNAVKASACWVWKPKTKFLDHVSKHNSALITLKKFDYIDAQGRSKHMTGNMSYLIDYEEIDGGFVAFGGNPKRGKITRKCLINDPHHTPTIIQPSTQPQKTQKPRKPKSKDTQVPQPSNPSGNVTYEAVHKEMGTSLVRASTTASSLETEQDSGGSRSLKRKEFKTHKLMMLYKVGLSTRIESSGDEESLGKDASKQERINAIDAYNDITLVSVQNVDEEMFDVDALNGEEVFVYRENEMFLKK
ncbi:hypothetical protein Tco_0562283 [Tanacetum coccineum]